MSNISRHFTPEAFIVKKNKWLSVKENKISKAPTVWLRQFCHFGREYFIEMMNRFHKFQIKIKKFNLKTFLCFDL